MDKLKQLVKECMEQLESTFPGDHFDEQEAFDVVMQMIQDQVENYTFADYKKQSSCSFSIESIQLTYEKDTSD